MADAGPFDRDDDRSTGETDRSITDDDRRFSFRLPPFRLPAFFPADFELVLPAPGQSRRRPVGARWVVAFALLVDVVDAMLAATVGGPALVARSFAVFGLAIAIARTVGLVTVWELVATLIGAATVTAFPSVTVLLLVRARLLDEES
ncbi:MAG: hypothetical protein ABEJ44_03910 [Halanaeroarchaeum sp.]